MTTMIIGTERQQNQEQSTTPATFNIALQSALEVVGEKYGIYDAMAQTGPVTPQELAGFTGLSLRHTKSWLQAQAATGALHFSRAADRYCLWCPINIYK